MGEGKETESRERGRRNLDGINGLKGGMSEGGKAEEKESDYENENDGGGGHGQDAHATGGGPPTSGDPTGRRGRGVGSREGKP
jgi:hypothetical protein